MRAWNRSNTHQSVVIVRDCCEQVKVEDKCTTLEKRVEAIIPQTEPCKPVRKMAKRKRPMIGKPPRRNICNG